MIALSFGQFFLLILVNGAIGLGIGTWLTYKSMKGKV